MDTRTGRKTILAVDDSLTMQKVFKMTFAGEDLTVATVGSVQDALNFVRKERPELVLADVSLEGASGYELCKSIKDEFKTVPVIILSSKQNPYDTAKGQASGADEHFDKPFETAKFIDLVKKVLAKGQSMAPAPFAATAIAAPPPPKAPTFGTPAAPVTAPKPLGLPVVEPAPRVTTPGFTSKGVEHTPAPRVAAPVVDAPIRAPAVERERPAALSGATVSLERTSPVQSGVAAPAPVQSVSSASSAVHAGNGAIALPTDLKGKLELLGLSNAQVEGVLSLSREIVEKVVWEVVPTLAELLIKEEIARLTK